MRSGGAAFHPTLARMLGGVWSVMAPLRSVKREVGGGGVDVEREDDDARN